jgi:GT2 family glycosyltransferase
VTVLFQEYELLAGSGLFDAEYYLQANPDLSILNTDPLIHYLERGCREGRDPSARFDTSHYLSQCQELQETPENPLLHYLTVGAGRGLSPRPGSGSLSATAALSAGTLSTTTLSRTFLRRDTLATLSSPVSIEIDLGIACAPHGVFLRGWLLAPPGCIKAVRVRCGEQSGELAFSRSLRVARPDVLERVGRKLGLSDPNCGFIAFVPMAITSGQALSSLEIELTGGEVGFKELKLTSQPGLEAIRQALDGIELASGDLDRVFDHILGPAVAAINSARLQTRPAATRLEFGAAPQEPLCTLIVTLYGRVDFLEYQMALFSRRRGGMNIEIVYVLDDPSKRRELEVLALSVFERFQVPFRVLSLAANMGFAPANNVGLATARGRYICFLNSDVMPIHDDWLERLIDGLERNPDIGAIGARLLFEDGSIQHEGCFYRPLRRFAGWTFIEHNNKGRRPNGGGGLQRRDAITGACLVMQRSLANELGGFDESFIIGDFEDSDLCLRLKTRGLTCAVEQDVHLYHLERKSQAAPSEGWRFNLTLYNAWIHERRWFGKTRAEGG